MVAVRVRLRTGWNGFAFGGTGDFTGDDTADLVTREDATGILWPNPRWVRHASVHGISMPPLFRRSRT
ncbi:hypothetical protein [Streptomyces sp. NPDC051677]|uniref:hypothetical protein n=1 Tax=Streptomyces sp. NPDC051677 TaxID=3365669 RepID=UPI0037D57D99